MWGIGVYFDFFEHKGWRREGIWFIIETREDTRDQMRAEGEGLERGKFCALLR